jgi:hypothetical protein
LRPSGLVPMPRGPRADGDGLVAAVREVERVAAAAGDQPLRIDLAHLVGVDPAGLQTLRRLRGRGARLTGASPFVELLLERTVAIDHGVGHTNDEGDQ